MSEPNMRIHIAVMSLILPFAWFFGLSRAEWGVLILSIGFVLAAELFNTSVEKVSDAVTEEYSEFIKLSKDISAGAVIVAAVTAVFVGVALFGDFKRIWETLTYIVTHIHAFIIFLIIFISDIYFLIRKNKKGNFYGKE